MESLVPKEDKNINFSNINLDEIDTELLRLYNKEIELILKMRDFKDERMELLKKQIFLERERLLKDMRLAVENNRIKCTMQMEDEIEKLRLKKKLQIEEEEEESSDDKSYRSSKRTSRTRKSTKK